MRLSGVRQFAAVYQARMSRHAGPLVVYLKPNGLNHLRLGLTVSRRVGRAVRRNRIKRRLREAVRLHQHELPAGYDVVVRVLPHEPLTLDEYSRLIRDAAEHLHQRWQRMSNNTARQ